MRKYDANEFVGGWLVGNFEPTIFSSKDFEVALKIFSKGDTEDRHYQLSAHELTIVVSGDIRIGELAATSGEGILIDPLECSGFEALSEVSLVCVKWPSIPQDKVMCHHRTGSGIVCN